MAAGPCRAKDPVQRMRRALHEGTQGGLTRGPRDSCCHMLPCLCCWGIIVVPGNMEGLAMHDVPVLSSWSVLLCWRHLG